jgi:hypothetical protein
MIGDIPMRILATAAVAILLPLGAFAQTEPQVPAAPAPAIASVSPTIVVAGVVAAAVVADIVTNGALSGPLLRVVGWEAAPAARAASAPAVAAAIPAPAPVVVAAPASVAPIRPWWRFW